MHFTQTKGALNHGFRVSFSKENAAALLSVTAENLIKHTDSQKQNG